MKGLTVILLALVAVVGVNCKSPEEFRQAMKASFAKCKEEFGKPPPIDFSKPPSIPREVKCMFNCVMEELGIIDKETVDGDKFAEIIVGGGYLDPEAEEKFKALAKDCEGILNSDRCVRGSEVFHCLKSAASSLGAKHDM